MKSDFDKARIPPEILTPFLEGFYERVADAVRVDVSSVIRAARGEVRSKAIEDALRRELEAAVRRIRKEHVA
jgi:hypothetical protein